MSVLSVLVDIIVRLLNILRCISIESNDPRSRNDAGEAYRRELEKFRKAKRGKK